MFKNIFNRLVGNKIETPDSTNVTTNNIDRAFSPSPDTNISPSLDPDLRKENTKLQRSNNIFYSIFVILFEDSKNEQLSPDNFNAKFLTRGLDNIDNETLSQNLPKIIKYLSKLSIFSKEFLGKSCLLFRDDNFKFMKLKTSDTEDKEADFFIEEVDKELEAFDKIITKKRKLLDSTLSEENNEPLLNFSSLEPSQKFANYKFFDAVKSHLKTMIKNYFKYRAELYNNIVRELFVFDKKSKAIVSLNSKLTYKYISEISKKAEIILLDLHISIFNTLNSILTDCVNEINTMKTNENSPNKSLETVNSITQPSTDEYVGGTKTRKHRTRSITRSITRNITRSIKRNIKRNIKRKTRRKTTKLRK